MAADCDSWQAPLAASLLLACILFPWPEERRPLVADLPKSEAPEDDFEYWQFLLRRQRITGDYGLPEFSNQDPTPAPTSMPSGARRKGRSAPRQKAGPLLPPRPAQPPVPPPSIPPPKEQCSTFELVQPFAEPAKPIRGPQQTPPRAVGPQLVRATTVEPKPPTTSHPLSIQLQPRDLLVRKNVGGGQDAAAGDAQPDSHVFTSPGMVNRPPRSIVLAARELVLRRRPHG